MVERHLAPAEQHVTPGSAHVETQKAIVDELEGAGRDTATARALPRTFKEAQALHVTDRDRIAAELAALH